MGEEGNVMRSQPAAYRSDMLQYAHLYRTQFIALRRHHRLSRVYAREALFYSEDDGALPLLIHTSCVHLAAVLSVRDGVPEDIGQSGCVYRVVLHLQRDGGPIRVLLR